MAMVVMAAVGGRVRGEWAVWIRLFILVWPAGYAQDLFVAAP
jgi:hypothetical protein